MFKTKLDGTENFQRLFYCRRKAARRDYARRMGNLATIGDCHGDSPRRACHTLQLFYASPMSHVPIPNSRIPLMYFTDRHLYLDCKQVAL